MEIINIIHNKTYDYSKKRWAIFNFDDEIVEIFLTKEEALKQLPNFYKTGCYVDEIYL